MFPTQTQSYCLNSLEKVEGQPLLHREIQLAANEIGNVVLQASPRCVQQEMLQRI